MPTTVCSGTPDDFVPIARHYGRGGTPWDPFGEVEKLEEIPIDGLLVAEVEGEYAGFLYWFQAESPWFDVAVERYAQIEEVQVLPRYRGKGVGRALLEEALSRLQGLPVDAIYIETTEGNSVARHLYESVGFELVHRAIIYRLEGGHRASGVR